MQKPTLYYSLPTDILGGTPTLTDEEAASIAELTSAGSVFKQIEKHDLALRCNEQVGVINRIAFHRNNPSVGHANSDSNYWATWERYLPQSRSLSLSCYLPGTSDLYGTFVPVELAGKLPAYRSHFANLQVRWRSSRNTMECALFGNTPGEKTPVLLAIWADEQVQIPSMQVMASIVEEERGFWRQVEGTAIGGFLGAIGCIAAWYILKYGFKFRFELDYDPRHVMLTAILIIVLCTFLGLLIPMLQNMHLRQVLRRKYGCAY